MTAWTDRRGWLDYDPNDIFDRIQRELLEQERKLRREAEARADALHRVLYEVAKKIAPREIDELRRKNPDWGASVAPEAWQAFFEHVLDVKPRLQGWTQRGGDGADVERLRRDVERQAEELARARADAARLKEEVERLQLELERLRTEERERADHRPTSIAHRPSAAVRQPDIELPPAPPTRFRKEIPQHKWPRVATVMDALARGISLQREVAEILVARDDRLNDPSSGSLKRLFAWLQKQDFVTKAVSGLESGSRWTVILLTERGRDLARAMGLEVRESEWERLMRLHGGERQQGHALLVLLFAWQARKRGWSIQVCPDVAGPAEPDVLVEKGGERIYVEVEAESGEPERRMRKWRNMVDLQGFVALAAPDEGGRKRLTEEARAVSEHGKATDVQSLLSGNSQDNIWTEEW